MDRSIKELAKGFRRSPEELLKTVREAGLDKNSVDDTLSPAERNKLIRGLNPGRGQSRPETGKATGAVARKSKTAAGKTGAGPKGGMRNTVNVEVRKKSIRVAKKTGQAAKTAGRPAPLAPKAKTAAPDSKATPAAKPAAAQPQPRKRVYSAETKKVVQQPGDEPVPDQADAKAAAQAEDGQGADAAAKPAAGNDAVADPAGSRPGDGDKAAKGKAAKTTGAGDKGKPASDGAKTGAKGEAARKRPTSKRDRLDIIEEEDYALASGGAADSAAVAPAQTQSGEGLYDPSSYLHIKKSFRKRRKVKTQSSQKKENIHAFRAPADRVELLVDLPDRISLPELARRLRIKIGELSAQIKASELEVADGHIDQVSAALIVEKLGHKAELLESDNPLVRAKKGLKFTGETGLVPPVVTIMGHVDHGKTTLIDQLRRSHIASGEYGAITQHIGAYRVPVRKGEFITFLDTPGHAAFANMREHGARVTEIVVIVVAADDGVKPQTIESIEYARRYNIPIVVAINKIDKDNANPELVRTALSEHELVSEEWGGETQFVEISALNNQKIDQLLEAIYLQAEMLDKKVHSQGDGFGYVIESGQRKGLGITATVLLKEGAIKKGDVVSAAQSWGRVRFLFDEDNKPIKELTPGLPATLVGLSKVVQSGSEIFATTEALAKEIELYARQQEQGSGAGDSAEIDADALFADLAKKANTKTVNLYIKTDVQGSTEAVRKVLDGVDYPEFEVSIVACRQGGIHESDVQTAQSTQSIIVGFNVSADGAARKLAENSGVEMRLYRSVYEIFDYVEGLAHKNIDPVVEYTKVGEAKVREVFRSSAFGSVAGCLILEGAVHKDDVIRVVRDAEQIFEGRLDSLRRFKDDVQVVNSGSECGIAVRKFEDLRENDRIEAYKTKEIAPSRESARSGAS